jgi:hypothetical protein
MPQKLRTFWSSTETWADFETKAEIPAEKASFSENTSPYSLNMMSGTEGIRFFRARAASIPFITGIEKSMTMTSGCNSWAPFYRLLSVCRFPAYFEVSFRRKQLAEKMTNLRIVIDY